MNKINQSTKAILTIHRSRVFVYAFDTSARRHRHISSRTILSVKDGALGGKIYADTSIELTHTGYYPQGRLDITPNN